MFLVIRHLRDPRLISQGTLWILSRLSIYIDASYFWPFVAFLAGFVVGVRNVLLEHPETLMIVKNLGQGCCAGTDTRRLQRNLDDRWTRRTK